ncbi:MAG: AraC family transcriptional regulator [Prevotella sp.]|nr:AraC family transcriptional regulator [Prevotella sp.]
MNDQIREDTLFIILYSVVTVMAAVASFYLLFRRGNAFAADITPPRRLRRWTAAFLAVSAMGHLWYLPAFVLDSGEAVMLSMLIGALLDCMLTIPLALIVILCMLQDRRRPLWPVGVMVAPLVVGLVVCIVTRSEAQYSWLRGYFLLAAVGFTIYMVREVRRYGRWLRDNYADLENKEVWQSFVVLAVIMLMFAYYVVGYGGKTYEYIVQMSGLVLIGYLLWRVETLSSLSPDSASPLNPAAINDDTAAETDVTETVGDGETEGDGKAPSTDDDSLPTDNDSRRDNGEQSEALPEATYEQIGTLLQQRCIDTRLYLQHGLTLSQLAQIIGTNRTYLGLYFVRQNTNYNAYINDQRILYFVRLYDEAVATGRDFTVQQLANQSGYRSYKTFSLAFKQRMGQSVMEWINTGGERLHCAT